MVANDFLLQPSKTCKTYDIYIFPVTEKCRVPLTFRTPIICEQVITCFQSQDQLVTIDYKSLLNT